MRITTIEFWSVPNVGSAYHHATLSVSEADLSQSYILKSAAGLDPQEIFNQFYGVAGNAVSRYSRDQRYYNLYPAPRVVVFGIKVNPQYEDEETPSTLRDALYKMIAYDRTGGVEIRFMDGVTCVAVLSGFISNFETDLFSKDSDITITVKCIYPFFRAPTITQIKDDIGVLPGVVFNDDVSTAPHGFYTKLKMLSNQTGTFTIQGQSDFVNASPFTFGFDFLTNDHLIMNTDPNSRELLVQRGFGFTYIMNLTEPTSIWPMIFPGLNEMFFPFDAEVEDFTFYHTYWGI